MPGKPRYRKSAARPKANASEFSDTDNLPQWPRRSRGRVTYPGLPADDRLCLNSVEIEKKEEKSDRFRPMVCMRLQSHFS
jgi:hypothetical protein